MNKWDRQYREGEELREIQGQISELLEQGVITPDSALTKRILLSIARSLNVLCIVLDREQHE